MTRAAAKERIKEHLKKRNWSVKYIEDILNKIEPDNNLTIDKVLAAAYLSCGVLPSKIKSISKERDATFARYLCYDAIIKLGYSQKYTAKILGRKQHGSVSEGISKLSNILEVGYEEESKKHEHFQSLIKEIN